MFFEILKFFAYSIIIVIVSKYILVRTLRKLAENLSLKPRIVGNIAGIATSIPEFLTVSISSFKGLISTSMYNILSSNVINFVQYIFTILINRNLSTLKNKAIFFTNILALITILIPIFIIYMNINLDWRIAPIFFILYFLFIYLNKIFHEKYLKYEDEEILKEEEKRELEEKKENKTTVLYVIYLILSGIVLFILGNLLGNVLEELAVRFNISQTILGILLGFITSIPELITFLESQRYYKIINKSYVLGVAEATNNLFYSNILNLFFIQAIGLIIFSCIYWHI